MKPWGMLATENEQTEKKKVQARILGNKTEAFEADTEVSKQKEQRGCCGDQGPINEEGVINSIQCFKEVKLFKH